MMFVVVISIDFLMFVIVVKGKKCCGKYGVIIFMNEFVLYMMFDVNWNCFMLLLNVFLKFVVIESFFKCFKLFFNI